MGGVGRGEVTQQGEFFFRGVRRQDDLIGGIDLWFWKTETVKPYHRSGAQRRFTASSHAVVAVGCVLFLNDLCGRVSMK